MLEPETPLICNKMYALPGQSIVHYVTLTSRIK